jgi:putative hydrolase of the HAD superfamily
LNALRQTHALHLITNGFLEVQRRKLASSGLAPYFREVIISEAAGARKPEKAIFDHALARAGAAAGESVMIGDDFEADIEGALGAGWDAVFFNPQKRPHSGGPTHEVGALRELLDIL